MNELVHRAQTLIRRQPYHLVLPFIGVWVIKPFYGGHPLDWIGLAAAWSLFLILYVLAHMDQRFTRNTALCGLTVLGAFYVPLNPEASGIFAFVAAIYAASQPRPHLIRAYLFGINLLLLAEALFFHLNLWTWVGGGSGAVLFTLYVLFNARERETNLQLRLAQNEIGRLAKLTERDRIARDLHDVLGHTLSLIAMKSELAQKHFSADPEATLGEAQQIEVLSRQALIRVREVIHGYSAKSFHQEVERLSAALSSVGLTVECSLEDVGMNAVQESVFAMVLQEATTNIIRHAQAGKCKIELRSSPVALELSVTDDGRGSSAYDGFGLRGMEERLRLLGGSLRVAAQNGTLIQASLPRS